jgi:hypothetical protein
MEGQSSLEALDEMMRFGDYSFDEANAIGAAASTAYCYCAWDAANGFPVNPQMCRPFETNYRNTGTY